MVVFYNVKKRKKERKKESERNVPARYVSQAAAFNIIYLLFPSG